MSKGVSALRLTGAHLAGIAAVAGVALLWAGLAGVCSALGAAGVPGRAPRLLVGLLALTVGLWVCWRAAAVFVRPPPIATSVVDRVCAGLAAATLLAGGILAAYAC
jgi:hypothetical protein